MTQQTWLVDQLFATIPGVALGIFDPGMLAHNILRAIDFTALPGIFRTREPALPAMSGWKA